MSTGLLSSCISTPTCSSAKITCPESGSWMTVASRGVAGGGGGGPSGIGASFAAASK